MRLGKFALLIGFVSMLFTSPATFAQTKAAKEAVGHSDAAMTLNQGMRKLWTDHVRRTPFMITFSTWPTRCRTAS